MRRLQSLFLLLAFGSAFGSECLAMAQVSRSAVDQEITSSLQKDFASNKDLTRVQPTVENGVVTLSGTVPSYRAKLEAVHDVQNMDNVNGFVNQIHVAAAAVPDAQLKKTLDNRLAYDRMYMGQTFNALSISVKNGHVTVSGDVRDYPDRDSALDIIDDTKGVTGVTDKVKVAPLSPMDDQIRLEAARRIYSNPQFTQYAANPARPIRILVDNGHVTLVGVVNSAVDKAVIGNAVNTIPGVFGVKNDLEVAH